MTPDLRIALDDLNTIPNNPTQANKPRHSWTPASLIHLAQNPPAPPVIGSLLYPGKRTLLSGETESLKTWLALILAKAEMLIEIPVAWVDLDDMGAGAILQRLRALEVPDPLINDFFHYYQPDERLYNTREQQRTEQLTDVLAQLAITGARLMVIDAFNPMLSLHGLDPNSTPDVETFWREIANPIAATGAAPVLLDHVAKNAETRGKYSYGSERKASGATVHIGAHTLEALTIGGEGRAILTTHKDRPAYLPRPTIGILKLVSHPHSDTETIEYTLDQDQAHTTGDFRPTILMERISRELELRTTTTSQNWVEKNIQGKVSGLRKALKQLIDNGYIDPNTHLSLIPYRQESDPLLDLPTTPDPGASPVRPRCVPNLVSTGCVPASLPLRGDAAGRTAYSNGTHHVPDHRVPTNGTAPNSLFLDTEPDHPDDPADRPDP